MGDGERASRPKSASERCERMARAARVGRRAQSNGVAEARVMLNGGCEMMREERRRGKAEAIESWRMEGLGMGRGERWKEL